MAGKIKHKLGIEPELIQGAGGVFDVRADGKLVYSRDDTGTFPDEVVLVRELGKL